MGDWTGGYNESGGFDGVSEYDRDGNYVGPQSEAGSSEDTSSEDISSEDNSEYDSSQEDTGEETDEEDGYYDSSEEYSEE